LETVKPVGPHSTITLTRARSLAYDYDHWSTSTSTFNIQTVTWIRSYCLPNLRNPAKFSENSNL